MSNHSNHNDQQPSSSTDTEQNKRLRRSQRWAKVLDTQFGIPGTRFQFGIEPLIGLIPVIGDYAGAVLSGTIVLDAARSGASKRTLMKMMFNILLEFLIGLIPFIGDIFDFFYKANIRNTNLFAADIANTDATPTDNQKPAKAPKKNIWLASLLLFVFISLITAFWVGIFWLLLA